MTQRRYCLITGASRGIGRDLAREFARNGHALILVARDKVALTVLRDELHGYTPDIRIFDCDLANPQSCIDLVAQLKQQQLTVDILVNNAGVGMCEDFVSMPIEAIQQMIAVNISALTLLTRFILPDMYQQRQGRILNVASTAAYQPGPRMAVYYATKAYVLWLTEAIAEEVREYGVNVTALCPGPTRTDFIENAKIKHSKLVGLVFMSSAKVAQKAYQGMMRNKRVIIPGIGNRMVTWLARLSPRVCVLKTIKYFHQPRQE